MSIPTSSITTSKSNQEQSMSIPTSSTTTTHSSTRYGGHVTLRLWAWDTPRWRVTTLTTETGCQQDNSSGKTTRKAKKDDQASTTRSSRTNTHDKTRRVYNSFTF